MKKWLKVSTALLTASLVTVAGTMSVFACTGVYAGSDVTDDGSTYYGRSEDFGPSWNKIFTITEAATHEEGEMLIDTLYGFEIPYPAETCRYSIMRDVPEIWEEYGYMEEPYAEAGVNEYGVSMTATVSTYDNGKVEEVDPLIEDGGLSETSIGTLILQSAKTAREGVEIITDIVDEYGAAECNAIFISDSNETWYLEIVSGHQYAAVKMDSSKVSVVPNMMMLDQINVNDENVIASEDLITIPKENGFLYTETPDVEGSIHVAKTYSEGYPSHSSYRAWQGMNILNPDLAKTVNPVPISISNLVPNANRETAEGPYVLQFDPSKKVDIKTMIQVLQTRGEGSEYDSNEGDSVYPIGNEYQAEDHIFQVRSNLPVEIATVQWQAMGPAEFSIFIPYYTAAMTKTPEVYHNESLEYNEDSMYWVFDELYYLANENRNLVADQIKQYFGLVQDSIIEQQKDIDVQMQALAKSNPELVSEKAEELADQLANQVYEKALTTLNEVQAYLDSDQTEAFKLSLLEDAENTMPTYEFGKAPDNTTDPGENENPGDNNIDDNNPGQIVDNENDGITNNTDNITANDNKNGTVTSDDKVTQKDKADQSATTKSAKTEDNSNIVLWMIVMAGAIGIISFYAVNLRRNKEVK